MNKKTLVIIALQTFIIVVLFWLLAFYGKDEYESYSQQEAEEDIASRSNVVTERGVTVVTILPETQQQSGITSTKLKPATHQAATSSFGSVLNIDPLLELRTRYLAARAEADVVRASIANSQQEYQRLAQLNRDNRNVSDRAVSVAEAAWKSDEAKLAAAETSAASIRDTMRQQWGDTLTGWATQHGDNELVTRLLQYREVLLQATLPFEAPNPSKDSTLMIEPTGTQGKAVRAIFVSASPQGDAAIQGKTYYYRAPADNLRSGMRITVRLADPGKTAAGVIVPGSAVVWYAGKAWVYRKDGGNRFSRHQISTENEAGNGWFNASGMKPGDEVVTSGAQLLLSEEFKYQIKNENED